MADDTSGLTQLANTINLIRDGAAQVEQTLDDISHEIGGTRCVHGATVNLSAGSWAAKVPSWVDICDTYGMGSYIAASGYNVGLRSIEDWKRVARLDPIAGIAAPGTPFGELNVSQQRGYMANAAAIAAAQSINDLKGYHPTWDKLSADMDALGWRPWSGLDNASTAQARMTGVDPQSGQPMQLIIADTMAAIARLSAPDIESIGTPGDDGFGKILHTDLELGMGEQFPQNAEVNACLALAAGAPRSDCLTRLYKTQPDLAVMYEATQYPWKPVADPEKWIQAIRGVDNRHYTVLGKGARQSGIRTAFVAGLAALGALVVATVASVVIGWFILSKKGKKIRKKIFG